MRGDPLVHEFHRIMELIARGERCVLATLTQLSHLQAESLVRSYSRRKALKGTLIPGSSKVIYEAKLTKGDRILYTERLYNQNCRSVIVWCVTSHDKISTYAERIRDSYRKFEQRLLEQKKLAPCSMGAVDELLDETIMRVVLFPYQRYRLDLFFFAGWIQAAILYSELLNAQFSI